MNSEISTNNTDPKAFKFNLSERFRGYLPVVVDVETAGFDPKVNALLEIALMTVSPDEQGFLHPGQLMSACIRPFEGSELKKENLDFLGIDPFDESRNLQDEATVLPLFFKAVKKEMNFDLGFVLEAAKRIGWEKKCPFHPFSILDTASLSALVYGQTVLAKACRSAGLTFDNRCAHGAAYDTQMECELFCKLYNRFTTFAGLPDLSAAD